MLLAGEIHYIQNYEDILNDPVMINDMRDRIKNGDVYICRSVVSKQLIGKLINWLSGVGRGSLPNYHAIEAKAPNYHRVNIWDDRAYVKGCFHQFSFFPWNQDVFQLFDKTRDVFYIKNLVNGQPKDKFLKNEPEDGCTARLSFQFYPKSIGGLNKHSDPVDHHQLVVPILIMSEKGRDFTQGGLFVEDVEHNKVYVDELCGVGDVVLFNAQVPHGVSKIDPEEEEDWLSFEGRWMMIFATNKLGGNQAIQDAVDLEDNE